MMMAGKTVLVTGGGTGIGEAVARDVVAEGGRVVITGRRADAIEAVAADLGDAALAVAADAGSKADMERVVAAARQRFSPIDAVVACAGVMGATAVADTSDEEWMRVMHGNLTTMFVTARAALPSLIERRGAFVAVSSVAAITPVPHSCGYTTSKHAMIGLAKSMAVDYGPHGVRVNVVCPGWVKTPMADGHMSLVIDKRNCSVDEAYDYVSSDVPLRRAATPAEIAAICTFLSSARSSAMTGSIITADGGTTIICAPMLKVID